MTIITNVQSVGPRELRARRVAVGLTQRRLSALAGCSLSWIANAEGGYIPRSGPTLARVLDALDEAQKRDDPATRGEAVEAPGGHSRHGTE